jgi:16S rRNA (uracil1498-N3)-methyltransferase
MPDYRCFASVSDRETPEIILSSEESHHLVRVNRARPGDPVVAFDGRGREWICECLEADRRAARLKVLSRRELPLPPGRITLVQALPKGKSFEMIIRKATEIGVARIIPLISARTEVRLDDARQEAKGQKWEATAIEAAKQSGNSYLPEIAPVQSVEEFLQTQAAAFDLKLVASLEKGAQSLRTLLHNFRETHGHSPANPLWLVGPEGDFTPEEYRAAKETGFAPVSLGPLVLRCDTADLRLEHPQL